MKIRDALIEKLCDGIDPFAGVAATAPADVQGWNSEHRYLTEAVDQDPGVVLELGVWKGASTIFMAKRMKERGAGGVVLAVDTWLGSSEHRLNPEWRGWLGLESGLPTLYRMFLANVVAAGVQDYVVPLPLDSINAAQVVSALGIRPDAMHVDAGHDYRSVKADLETWWPLLSERGVLIGDDYDPSGASWPGVKEAVDEFARETLGKQPFEVEPPKFRMFAAAARERQRLPSILARWR